MHESASIDEAKRILPGALDVIASLSPDIWFICEQGALVAVSRLTGAELFKMPLEGRIVMAEGAQGSAVPSWLRELGGQ